MFNHKSSLRTIDHTITKQLLTEYKDHDCKLSKIHTLESKKVLLEVSSLLTPDECIFMYARLGGFEVKSALDFREASRSCVIDTKLAKSLWRRLRHIIKPLRVTPYGIGVNKYAKWYPYGINECFRLSLYQTGSSGFAYHYDSQLTTNEYTRSALFVFIYLNDRYNGGKTEFFDNTNQVYNVTPDQEIKINGGIDKYTKYNVNQSVGNAVIFEHSLLHCSTPITSSTKYVLRTDVLYKSIEYIPKSINYNEYRQYRKCLKLFREAQNKELDGDYKLAGMLYEKSLSMRINYDEYSNVKYNTDIWKIIYKFLNWQSLIRCTIVNNFHYVLITSCNTYERCASDKISNGKYYFTYPYIPTFISRYGTTCKFHYSNKDYFLLKLDQCLQVIAMYALFQFGNSNDYNDYIASYDSKDNTLIKCSLTWLLTCAFYNFTCNGQVFNISKLKLFKRGTKINIDSSFINNIKIDRNNWILNIQDFKYIESLKQFKTPGHTILNLERKYNRVTQCDENICNNTVNHTSNRKILVNNLIFDFKKHKLDIKSCTGCYHCKNIFEHEQAFIVNIKKLELKSFHHAGSICVAHHKPYSVTTSTKTTFEYNKLIDTIHIIVSIKNNQVYVRTNFDAISVF